MAVGVGEIPSGSWCRCAVSFPGQAPPGHRVRRQGLEIRCLHTGDLSGLDRLVTGRLGLGRCRLGFLVQLGLLSSRCIGFAGGSRLGPGFLSFLLPLTCSSRGGLRFHLLTGLRI